MIAWFRNHAPIRTKFKVIVAFQVAVAALSLGLIYMAAVSPPAEVWDIMLGGCAMASLPVLLTWFSGKLISDPYVATVVRMEALTTGDLDSPIQFTDHRDCVGRMTRAMQVFRQNAETIREAEAASDLMVRALGAGLTRLAGGDLSLRLETPFAPHYESLRCDFNAALEAVAATLSTVTTVASGINNGAGDIRQASDDLSRRTEQQAAALEETAAAMEEITSTVRQTADGAARANALVSQAQSEAEASGEVVQRAVAAMEGIERTSSEISEIISVIDGIAFQTNLLALNAGVEAARAGDAGKGFAVVASEVRALAQRSADAAKDVKTRITASTEQVEVGAKLVSATGSALHGIIDRVGEISGIVSEIAGSAERQAIGLKEVSTAISEMDGVTQQNAAMVEEATAATRTLASEAEELAQEVARFKLAAAEPAPAVPARAAMQPVHQLQERAAQAGRQAAQAVRRQVRGGAAAAVAVDDDWSSF
ncbi:methyl-accepting chemotaxis protein [Sphingomonas sp. RHCKR7]|uniref:methyl-accepting chemotaxis protein n=1 Tax=Sphingomonas folli TaxID=2862497 RepID=UPI001C93659F|nr:methyl-accepting chemotaxis protein [Sphingomonas folli]MBW6528507.1 methyl-accepting chemotaxis protein [Sphingomonas folli]